MSRLLYISSVAVPHQIQLCIEMQRYYDARFWFYEGPERTRGSWWHVDMGACCEVLPDSWFAREGLFSERYYSPSLAKRMAAFDPDIVMLGGFSIPGNVLAYRWAKRHGKKTVVFTERSRTPTGRLRKKTGIWRLLRRIYKDVDLVITCAADVVPQFRDVFGFGDKVVAGRYATDIDAYLSHSSRKPKTGYTYLFANRMTEIYGPDIALEVFARILAQYPGSRLLMNAAGEMGDACRGLCSRLCIESAVDFLTDIPRWEDLHHVYAKSDILLLPARFSNGNATIVEAMASGMGIVVSDQVLGCGRMIVDGKNGFNCEPEVGAFLSRVHRYIAEPKLLQVHGDANRELVAPLSAQGTAKQLAALLSSLVH